VRFETLCGLTTKCPPFGANRRWVWEWLLRQYRRMDNQALQFKGPITTQRTIACGGLGLLSGTAYGQAYNRILSL
jgi:hypothetical protein